MSASLQNVDFFHDIGCNGYRYRGVCAQTERKHTASTLDLMRIMPP